MGPRGLFSHRPGRAWAEDPAGRREGRHRSAGALRQARAAISGSLEAPEHLEQRLYPHHQPQAQGLRSEDAPDPLRQGLDLPRRLHRLVLHFRRAVLDGEGRLGRPLPGLQASGRTAQREQLFLPDGLLPEAAHHIHRRPRRLHPAAVAEQRSAGVPPQATGGPVHLAAQVPPLVGHRAALRFQFRHLRLVRCPGELRLGAGLSRPEALVRQVLDNTFHKDGV